MKGIYATIMQDFFGGLVEKTESEPPKLALAFADFFRKKKEDRKGPLPAGNANVGISILAHDTTLSFLTKRTPLITDTTVLTHINENKHCFYSDNSGGWQVVTTGINTYYLRCPNLNELGVWLNKCKPLLLSGDIFYFPDIVIENYWDDYGFDRQVTTEQPLTSVFGLIVKSRIIVDTLTTNFTRTKSRQPLLEVDLPYIENVDLDAFSKIITDKGDIFDSFRCFLREHFIDSYVSKNVEFDLAKLEKINIQLLEGVRKLNSDLDGLKRDRAFQESGAVIATTPAMLVFLNSESLKLTEKLIDTSGGMYTLINEAINFHLKKPEHENAPHYLLWLFKK